MTSTRPTDRAWPAPVTSLGLTVYGCEPDEMATFEELAPRFGIVPTMTSASVMEADVAAAPGNRSVSVGHRSEIDVPALLTLQAAGVEHLSTRSIGLDHIDLDAARRLGIAVENVTYAPDGVADFTVMLLLMLIRDARDTVRSADECDFRLPGVRGRDLCDLTVGVVGVGSIGAAVIRRLLGFGCRVLATNNGGPFAAAAGVVSFDELLRESDVVTLHVPLSPATHHLVGRDAIMLMKPGALLVNTGRGGLVDTDALVGALERGNLGGAALDVLEGEAGLFSFDCTDRPLDHHLLSRLQRLPNVLVTPHTAYFTRRALSDTVEQTLIKCREFERSRTR